MRFSMLYSGEQILSFKSCLVVYAGDSLNLIVKLSLTSEVSMNHSEHYKNTVLTRHCMYRPE